VPERHPQRIAPGWHGYNAIAHLIGLRKPHVVQIVMQPSELLRQGHLEEADLGFWFFLAAQGQQRG